MSKVTRRRLAEAYQGEPDLVRQGSIRYALLGEVARCCTWTYGEMNSIGWEAERSLYAEMRGTCSAIMHALFYLLPETYSESPLTDKSI